MLSLVVSTLVLIASSEFKVTILIPSSEFDRTVPVPEAPFRHTNVFVAVMLAGIVAVHMMLKLLYDVAFKTVTVGGSTATLNSSSVDTIIKLTKLLKIRS